MGIRRNPAPPEIGVVDLDTAKRIKRGELRDMRDAVIKEGFSYGGRTYPIDPDIQLSMMIQFQTSGSFSRRLGYQRSTQKARTDEYAAVQHRIITILPKRPP